MSYNDVAIYKYGNQVQSSGSRILATRPVFYQATTLERYTPTHSNPIMSGRSGPDDEARRQLERTWRQDQLDKERMLKLGYVNGIPRSPDQEDWERQQEYLSFGKQASTNTSDFEQNTPQSGSIQYKSAQILDPKDGVLREVIVVEDSCCEVNFVHPVVVEHCHLVVQPAEPIRHVGYTGCFESSEQVQFSWIGHDGRRKDPVWAYVSPRTAPIQIGVAFGTAFSREHPNAFGSQALPAPALLNVQSQMKQVEQSQIESDKTSANAQAAELARKRQAQNERKQKQKQKQNSSSSSSKNSRSYKN
ncbi:hypothetical protein BKA64DRAFT_142829 [Cadophora sp. MPI-SDFR-AT-0126]|nr:hypothetical protein BKA64DRAFT_142829 [Leotiomycetes sp. MPI-SDFR-AT-0126]